jgi:hypothetical protein
MKKSNLEEMYSAKANGTLKEYCELHGLDYVMLNLVLREFPNAFASEIMGNNNIGLVTMVTKK